METTSVSCVKVGESMEQEEKQQEQVAPPAVVVVERKKMKLLVAMDDSEGSFYALKWTLDHIFTPTILPPHQPLNDYLGMLTILHVQQPFQPFILPAGPVVYVTTSATDSIRKAQEQLSVELLSRALQFCKGRPIKTETLILNGDPRDMICQAAEDLHPDLVVVGSRGLSKLKRAFLGSVSDYCAHHVKQPILIVKPH